MRRKRRNHSPSFKAKVAFAALKGEKMLADEKWAELMNNKRQSIHLNKLWNIKVAQFKQAKKDGRIEQFINDASSGID